MGFPALPPASIIQTNALGKRVLNAASTWAALARRAAFAVRGQRSGFVNGPSQDVVAMTDEGAYDFGVFAIGLPSSSKRVLTVWIYIKEFTTGNTTFYANFAAVPDADVSDSALISGRDGAPIALVPEFVVGTPSAAGWISADITIPSIESGYSDMMLGIHITARATAATEQTLGTIQVLTKLETTLDDGSEPVAAWPKLSLEHMSTPDRPDSISTVRILKRQSDLVVASYPQCLAAHSYEPMKATRTSDGVGASDLDSEAITLRYKVQRGPHSGDVRIRVHASQDTVTASLGDGTVAVWVDNDDGTFAETYESATLTGIDLLGWYEVVIPAANWGAGVDGVHDIKIKIIGLATEADGFPFEYGYVTADAIDIVEDPYDPSDFLIAAEVAVEPEWTPTRFITPAAGAPIVASYVGGALSGRKTDRRRLAENTLFAGLRKHQQLVGDWIGRNATSGLNGTTATGGSPVTLYRTKRTPTIGTGFIDVWACTRREGEVTPRVLATFELVQDGVALVHTSHVGAHTAGAGRFIVPSSIVPEVRQQYARWVYLGRLTVVPEVETEIQIKGYFVDYLDTSVTGTADLAVLEGAYVAEVPTSS